MVSVTRTTYHLPGQLRVTILQLPNHLHGKDLRSMLASNWYVLAGPTYKVNAAGTPVQWTGYGCYVGTSSKIDAQLRHRAGTSLHQWSGSGNWRLRPQTLALISKTGTPIDDNARLILEARLTRALSTAGYTVLNTIAGATKAHHTATRKQRHYACAGADRLARLLIDIIFRHHRPLGLGGSTHEQLVKLVLNQQPPRAMDIDDILHAAQRTGLAIRGAHPRQRTRRDLTTREADTGKPRVYRTHIKRRTVIYPATMTLAEARASYLQQHPAARTAQPHRTVRSQRPRRRGARIR